MTSHLKIQKSDSNPKRNWWGLFYTGFQALPIKHGKFAPSPQPDPEYFPILSPCFEVLSLKDGDNVFHQLHAFSKQPWIAT